MKTMKIEETREIYGGKTYYCPWGDYSSTSYWKTYAHALKCGLKHGYYTAAIKLILKGLGF